jgi:hypothetical protein
MSDSGRYYIIDQKTSRKFCVEPLLEGDKTKWGDFNPATKEIEGLYGKKHIGAINREDSIITEENGFKNIIELEPGISPDSYIDELLKNK